MSVSYPAAWTLSSPMRALRTQGLAAEADPSIWRRLIETNLLGVMYCVR